MALARDQRRPFVHSLMLGLIVFSVVSSVFISKAFSFQLPDSPAIPGLSLPSAVSAPAEAPFVTSAVLPDTMGREEYAKALEALAGQAGGARAEAEYTAAVATETPPPALFQRYSVLPGDTASAIAARFGIELRYLLWNNNELQDGDMLLAGATLYVPVDNGILHYVSYGETLSGIAAFYGVEAAAILAWPGNNIHSADRIVEDELIFIPNGVPPAPVFKEPTPVPASDPVAVVAPPAPTAAPGAGLIWPFSCSLSSYFGDGRGHAGIDIDGVCNPTGPVVAATSGTVIAAVTQIYSGYGYYVDIRSPEGIVTRYAHLSRVAVSMGQSVSQGQQIGNVGCTGSCSGNHLHFEVRTNGVPVNPLDYLP